MTTKRSSSTPNRMKAASTRATSVTAWPPRWKITNTNRTLAPTMPTTMRLRQAAAGHRRSNRHSVRVLHAAPRQRQRRQPPLPERRPRRIPQRPARLAIKRRGSSILMNGILVEHIQADQEICSRKAQPKLRCNHVCDVFLVHWIRKAHRDEIVALRKNCFRDFRQPLAR